MTIAEEIDPLLEDWVVACILKSQYQYWDMPTAIEWTDETWNPVTGCVKVSPGCKHCYAETFAERFRGAVLPNGRPLTPSMRASIRRSDLNG